MKWYCDREGCLATFPCSLHTTEEELQAEIEARLPTVVHKTTDVIRVIEVIPLPCEHNYPSPVKSGERAKFHAHCDFCGSIFYVEMKEDVCELTRVE